MKSKQSARMEDYLEAIYELEEEDGGARVSTIAKRLGVKMPSVDSAIKRLEGEGLVKHDRYGDVKLTREGKRIGKEISRRHEVLSIFLSEILGVDPVTSRKDACEIEHTLSPETERRLISFVEFILGSPGRPEWLKNYFFYYQHGERPEGCPKRCAE